MRRWGIGVTGSGLTHIAAGTSYPPDQHPKDHQLDWKHGRVLDSLQIVLITTGAGWFETRALGQKRVEAGMVFLLLPGVWHRYRPDPKTGWDESWIEIQGPVVAELLEAETFAPNSALRRGAIDAGLDEVLDRIHRCVREKAGGFQPEASAAALQALAICARIANVRPRLSHVQQAVIAAERYLTDHHAEEINVEALARDLGVAYSHFRRAFRAQTGFAPWQYVTHLRLTRARRMLASSGAKLDDVAECVGFHSGFHLSLAFKQAYGLPPNVWRKGLAREGDRC